MQSTLRVLRVLSVLFATVLLANCATTQSPEQPDELVVEVAAPVQPVEPIEYETRPFDKETLYELLVAEFALRRKRPEISLAYYLKQAFKTRDAGIAAHTVRLARHLRAYKQALDVAQLWVELEPDSVEARLNAAMELTRANRPFEALAHMKVVQALGGRTNFMGIASISAKHPTADRNVMLADIEDLVNRYDASADLLLAKTVLLKNTEQSDRALETIRVLLAENPRHVDALFLEAQLLHDLGQTDEAFQRIDQILAETPENSRLRLTYARMLTEVDTIRAQKQFEVLVSQQPKNGELIIALAMVYRENDNFGAMREQLKTLLALGQQLDRANFYLALDAERRDALGEAIEYYFAAEPGELFISSIGRGASLLVDAEGIAPARQRIVSLKETHPDSAVRLTLLEADLLSSRSDFEQAHLLLSTALAASPEQVDLLYARSMVNEKRNDIPALEHDLREMLKIEPDSALALNALGYSLTNLTDRHAEALDLISQAHKLKPDDPAILDSMGWVHFRLGNPAAALGFLQKAIELLPDPEVAAHLGEVLWTLGRQDEANRIWRAALEKSPKNRIVLDTVGRLKGAAYDLTGDPANTNSP